MKIIQFYADNPPLSWIEKIGKSDWKAGQYLAELLRNNKLRELCGESTEVLLLTENDSLLSFCTLAERDEIHDTDMSPWVGFVYTFPEYRGNRHIAKLLEHASRMAEKSGYEVLYISTDQAGLYEKFGFSDTGIIKMSIYGDISMIYKKVLTKEAL